jgi:hypothetical protein
MDLQSRLLTDGALPAVAVLAVGVVYCFLGYVTLKFLIGLTGFMLAGSVAGVIGAVLGFGNPIIAAIAFVAGGLCGVFALLFLYQAGIFLIGLIGAAILGHALFGARPEEWAPYAVLGCAAAGGFLALFFEKHMVILATAAIGGWLVVASGSVLAMGGDMTDHVSRIGAFFDTGWVFVAAWAVVALAGALAQFSVLKDMRKDTRQEA